MEVAIATKLKPCHLGSRGGEGLFFSVSPIWKMTQLPQMDLTDILKISHTPGSGKCVGPLFDLG